MRPIYAKYIERWFSPCFVEIAKRSLVILLMNRSFLNRSVMIQKSLDRAIFLYTFMRELDRMASKTPSLSFIFENSAKCIKIFRTIQTLFSAGRSKLTVRPRIPSMSVGTACISKLQIGFFSQSLHRSYWVNFKTSCEET